MYLSDADISVCFLNSSKKHRTVFYKVQRRITVSPGQKHWLSYFMNTFQISVLSSSIIIEVDATVEITTHFIQGLFDDVVFIRAEVLHFHAVG